MKNIFILYMPQGNNEAMVHYEDTKKKKVAQNRIFRHIDSSLQHKLRSIFREKPIAVWGSQDGTGNRPRFEKMQPGDDILIVEGNIIRLLGKVAATTINQELSHELWKSLSGEKPNPWKLIYFIANPVQINLSFEKFKDLFNYQSNWQLRGFTSVSSEKLDSFYDQFDDLYSVLLRIKNGEELKAKTLLEEDVSQFKQEPNDDPDFIKDEGLISDHIRMQWKLLKLGLKHGSKVWAPRSDQSRINRAYHFSDFESEFSAGIDTPARYVEQIDVVWKDEYRIDAAFEVENSTSIYSGLLRFSDLNLLAPNSSYPLYIVAPSSRKGAVFAQVKRPTFSQMDFEDKVRFLSYEAVDEIDSFFENSESGLENNVLYDRSEEVR